MLLVTLVGGDEYRDHVFLALHPLSPVAQILEPQHLDKGCVEEALLPTPQEGEEENERGGHPEKHEED